MVLNLTDLKQRFRYKSKPTERDLQDLIDTLTEFSGAINGQQIILGTLPITKIEDGPANKIAATDGAGAPDWRNPVVSGDLTGTLPAPTISDHVVHSDSVQNGSLPPTKISAAGSSEGQAIKSVAGVPTWSAPASISTTGGLVILSPPVAFVDVFNDLDHQISALEFPINLDWFTCDIADLVAVGSLTGRSVIAAIVVINSVLQREGYVRRYTIQAKRTDGAAIFCLQELTTIVRTADAGAVDYEACSSTCFIPTTAAGTFVYNAATTNNVMWTGGIRMTLLGYFYQPS